MFVASQGVWCTHLLKRLNCLFAKLLALAFSGGVSLWWRFPALNGAWRIATCSLPFPSVLSLLVGGWALPSEKWWTSSVGMMTFHSQLFMESHLKFIKIHGFPNISKPPTSLECSRILARPSRLGYIRDHLTTEWPNKNSRRLSHPSVPCPCWSRSRTRCFPGRFL